MHSALSSPVGTSIPYKTQGPPFFPATPSTIITTKNMYQKLDADKKETRLLTIEPGQRGSRIVCSLSRVALADGIPSFEALSYCWGSAHNRQEITICGEPMLVTANLYSALQHIRLDSRARTMWIDAVCINQDDLAERAQQVRLMRVIYSTCEQVVIWLGDEDDDSAQGLSGLGELAFFFRWVLPEGNTEEAMRNLVARPWFDRAWIIQETALAKAGIFMVGDASIALGTIEKSFLGASHLKERPVRPTYYDTLARLLQTRFRVQSLAGRGHGLGCPLPMLLQAHSRAQATDPRDNIFSLLGISEPCGGPDIVISYELSVQQVYANLIKRWIDHYLNLDVITYFLSRQERRLDLPSWMPDFSGRDLIDYLNLQLDNPYSPDEHFAAWAGKKMENYNRVTSFQTSGHPMWYFDRPMEKVDEMDWIRDPSYSRFLTLDGCHVDCIPESYFPSSLIDDALTNMETIMLREDFARTMEESGVVPILEQLDQAKAHRDAELKPWTRVFASIEPADLDDSTYLNGESKLTAYVTTLLGGGQRVYEEKINQDITELEHQYQMHMYKDAKFAKDSESSFRLSEATENWLKGLLTSRRFVVTTGGFYALVPRKAQAGDVIACLVGGKMPFVLRRKKWAITEPETSPPPSSQEEVDCVSAADLMAKPPNGPKYSGTSRGPTYQLVADQRIVYRQSSADLPEKKPYYQQVLKQPSEVPGSGGDFDPSWEIVGTAYVHGIMQGEMERKYEQGEVSIQTFLLV